MLTGLIEYAAAQFTVMGRDDARQLAVTLVATYEGIALLGNALQDPGLIAAEGRRLEAWIDDLASETTRTAAS